MYTVRQLKVLKRSQGIKYMLLNKTLFTVLERVLCLLLQSNIFETDYLVDGRLLLNTVTDEADSVLNQWFLYILQNNHTVSKYSNNRKLTTHIYQNKLQCVSESY